MLTGRDNDCPFLTFPRPAQKKNNLVSVILYPQLEITLRVIADRAFHGGCVPVMDIAAVPAVPLCGSVLFEDLVLFQIGEQLCIPMLVVRLHLGNLIKEIGNLFKPLPLRRLCKGRIQRTPFHLLTMGSTLRLSLVVPIAPAGYAAVIFTSPPLQLFEKRLGVLFLLIGRLLEG